MLEHNLKGCVALVTGGSRGIGRRIATALAEAGATVVINYNGSKAKADEAVDEIVSAGGNAVCKQCNVADFEAAKALVDEVIEEFGRIDILVNNAGITKDNLLLRMSEEEFDGVIETNLKGAFNMCKHTCRNFLKLKKGKIINISSVSGVLGNPGQVNYSASKAGIIGLTKSLARELASRGICVNAVAPGFVATEMTEAMDENVLESAKKTIPLGRLGTTDDIANMVLFLASEMSDYITGQVICVDGGMAI